MSQEGPKCWRNLQDGVNICGVFLDMCIEKMEIYFHANFLLVQLISIIFPSQIIYSIVISLIYLALIFHSCDHFLDFMLFLGGVAAAVPQLENVIALVGAVTTTFLAYIFPVAIYSSTFYHKLSRLELAKNFAIFLVGILGFLAGTYTSVTKMNKDLHLNKG